MRPIKDFDKVTPSGDYERLAPGGYVIRIQSVKDDKKQGESENSMLRIVYDIAEGPEAGRYKNEEPDNDYRHQFIRSYKEKALGMFKAFTTAVEESNPGYKWDWKEQTLAGKILGVTIGYKEYEANDGNIKERARIAACMSADRIRKGDYKVPELRKLPEAAAPAGAPVSGFSPLTDDDLPF